MKITIYLAALALLAICFTGCNTISGAGRDVSATGRGVSSGANAVKSSIQN